MVRQYKYYNNKKSNYIVTNIWFRFYGIYTMCNIQWVNKLFKGSKVILFQPSTLQPFNKFIEMMNIAADDKCLIQFQNLKYRRIEGNSITFVIDQERIVIERISDKKQKWEDFIVGLPENDYRYCVFDFEFTKSDNMAISKLIFLNWNPESTPLKKKVLYATAKQNFKSLLDINTKDYTLNSKSDLTFDDLVKQLSK